MVFNATFSNISVISRLLGNSRTTGPNKTNKIRSNPRNNIDRLWVFPFPYCELDFCSYEGKIRLILILTLKICYFHFKCYQIFTWNTSWSIFFPHLLCQFKR